MSTAVLEAGCLQCEEAETREWYAWIDMMPPAPARFHVVGEVKVPNAGVEPKLVERYPPSINPSLLILDLVFCQSPGTWSGKSGNPFWKQVRYDKYGGDFAYGSVQIYCDGTDSIATINKIDITM